MQWAAAIIAQCKAADVSVFVKQLGSVPITQNANLFDWPEEARLYEGKPGEGGFAFACIGLHDRKGGDWNEWPENFRVRQFPA